MTTITNGIHRRSVGKNIGPVPAIASPPQLLANVHSSEVSLRLHRASSAYATSLTRSPHTFKPIHLLHSAAYARCALLSFDQFQLRHHPLSRKDKLFAPPYAFNGTTRARATGSTKLKPDHQLVPRRTKAERAAVMWQ